MDAKAFFDLTAQMRDAQKAYFSTPANTTGRNRTTSCSINGLKRRYTRR